MWRPEVLVIYLGLIILAAILVGWFADRHVTRTQNEHAKGANRAR